MTLQRQQRLPCRRIPYAHRLVVGAGGQHTVIERISYRPDRAAVPFEYSRGLLRPDIPYAYRLVFGTGSYVVPIGRYIHAHHRAFVSIERGQQCSGIGRPYAHRHIFTARGDVRTIWRKDHVIDVSLVPHQDMQRRHFNPDHALAFSHRQGSRRRFPFRPFDQNHGTALKTVFSWILDCIPIHFFIELVITSAEHNAPPPWAASLAPPG